MAYTHKIVDGVEVALTPEEIANLEARDAAWTASEPDRQAERDRYHSLMTDDQALQMADRLADMTAQQIDQYFANNVTNLAQLGGVVRSIAKILAVKLTPRFGEPGA